jgi:hypothetical protein
MSLRRRLSALVAIALMPSLLLSAYNAGRWKIFLEDEANTTALSAARFISAEFGLVIGNSRQLMTAVAKYPNSRRPKPASNAGHSKNYRALIHLKAVIHLLPHSQSRFQFTF